MVMFEKNVTVDMSAENNYNCVTVKEGDYNSRYLRVSVLADGKKFEFSNDDIVALRCLHEDGTFDMSFGTIHEDSSVLIEIPKTILKRIGTADCDISITRGVGSLLSSSCIMLQILKSAVGEKIDTDEGVKTPSELWAKIEAAVGSSHTHGNLSVLEDIDRGMLNNISISALMRHSHSNNSVLDKINKDSDGNLTFNGKLISSTASERPTDTKIISFEAAIILDEPIQGGFTVCDNWSEINLPIGTEIKDIEFKIENEEDWTSIYRMHERDNIPYVLTLTRVYDYGFTNIFALVLPYADARATNYIYNAFSSYDSGSVRITYYTDSMPMEVNNNV